jgi:hypothetical protein
MRGPLGLNKTTGAKLSVFPLLIGFIALCGGSWDHAASCFCVRRSDSTGAREIRDLARASEAALDGNVVSIIYIRAPRPPSPGQSSLDERVATIAVNRRWRSTGPDTVLVRTPAYTTACGFGFTRGERYLLFPRRWKGDLLVDKCGPSRAWDEEAERLADILDGGDQPH